MPGIAHLLTRIYNRIAIEAPAAEIFDYVTTPNSWVEWMSMTLGVEGDTDHPAQVGERLTERFVAGGLPGTIHWEVRHCIRPHLWRIEGDAENGCKSTITYFLSERQSGTLYEREFCYWMPDGIVFPMLNRLILRKRGLRQSEEGLRRLKRITQIHSATAKTNRSGPYAVR